MYFDWLARLFGHGYPERYSSYAPSGGHSISFSKQATFLDDHTGFYKLPYAAQVFYRRFLLHNNFSSIPISLENISGLFQNGSSLRELVEMMHPDSIYKKHIATFSVIGKQKR